MTLERPMFPPRNHSRRGFLSQAAGVAAGGAVLALAPVASQPAAAASAVLLDANSASPVLRAAAHLLEEARVRLETAHARCDAEDAKLTIFVKANPEPRNRRGLKKWLRRWERNHVPSAAAWLDHAEAARQYRAAQMAVAKIDARDLSELAAKASLAGVYDAVMLYGAGGSNSAVIGYSVALNLLSLTRAVA